MSIVLVSKVIPESRIVAFAPHFDDFHFTLGGYILELKKHNLLDSKRFFVNIIFPRSNYLAGTGKDNDDTSLDRVKLATGKRILEDMNCIDELLGEFNYRYELAGEKECVVRGKVLAATGMEFPHGMYKDFNELDWQIFERMKDRVRTWAMEEDTALVFPIAIKEHIDHFIVREAGIEVAKELGSKAKAVFYFQEDKPYGGLTDETELKRIEDFISSNALEERAYEFDPEKIIELAFKHYISQVEEVYKTGIRDRSKYLMELYKVDFPCDRLFVYKK